MSKTNIFLDALGFSTNAFNVSQMKNMIVGFPGSSGRETDWKMYYCTEAGKMVDMQNICE